MDTAKVRNTQEYKDISREKTLELLETSAEGIAGVEADGRAGIFGLNEVTDKKQNPVLDFVRRYWGPMPWLLEFAIVLSCVLGHYLEAGIIFCLLTINTVVGHIQSRGSHRALEALKKRLAIKARVLRDGQWTTVESKEVVPGDIISVGLGDVVPADAKLLAGEVTVDQSVLTGESLSVDVLPSALLYSGSTVQRGEARCVVVNTGANSYFGRTAELVKIARPKSHQEQIMLAIVRYMMLLGVAALVLVGAFAIARGTGLVSVATFAVIFLMSAVPVALPAVMTIVQAVGATELARKGVLVTRLDSIEDAASVDVLCMDKTGTITQNKLSVGNVVPFGVHTAGDVAVTAGLACRGTGKDVIDAAILDYARSARIDLSSFEHISFTPFAPATKRSEAVVAAKDGQRFKVVKGAPQTVISLCKGLDETIRIAAMEAVEELSRKGDRALGVARSMGDGIDNLELVGLISLSDPPRPDSREMIDEARKLGVKPMMLTGDNIAIAREIAKRTGIGPNFIRMDDLKGLSEAEQARALEKCDGLAEIYPEDKYKIVKILQSQGHMVGMTGDGVNDAPALKQAELGIAVSDSTDVAKASASMVLTESGIKVIVEAVKTSRHIYQRMLSWVINKVAKTIQVVGLLTVGFFMFHDIVISLLGMALLIFANDFVTMSLATDNVEYTESPNKWNVKNITLASLVVGIFLVGEGVLALFIGDRYFHLPFDKLRTFTVLTLIFTSQFRVYIVRERNHFWSSLPGRELLIATASAVAAFSLLGVYGVFVPSLTVFQVLFTLAFSAVFTLAIDFPKYKAFMRFGL